MFSNKDVTRDPFIKSLQGTTTARIGIGHCGGRYTTEASLNFAFDLAAARDSVHSEIAPAAVKKLGCTFLASQAVTRGAYLAQAKLGRRLDAPSVARLKKRKRKVVDVQLVVSEGLSAEAFQNNVPEMLPLLVSRLRDEKLTLGPLLYVRRARVAVIDHIGEILKPRSALILIGERPGLGISDSLSGYFGYLPRLARVESERNVLSNIHRRGMPPAEAALLLAEALIHILKVKESGMHVRFDFQ